MRVFFLVIFLDLISEFSMYFPKVKHKYYRSSGTKIWLPVFLSNVSNPDVLSLNKMSA